MYDDGVDIIDFVCTYCISYLAYVITTWAMLTANPFTFVLLFIVLSLYMLSPQLKIKKIQQAIYLCISFIKFNI